MIIPPWVISRLLPAIGIALMLVAVVDAIDDRGYARAAGEYKLKIGSINLAHTNALRDAELEAKQRRDAQSRMGLRQAESLIAAKALIDAQTIQLQKRTRDVSTFYRAEPAIDLASVPSWIVTNGWVCDYNRATGYGMPSASDNASGVEDPACTSDPFSRSDIGAEAILNHHNAYGAYCRKVEEQRDRLIDFSEFIERWERK